MAGSLGKTKTYHREMEIMQDLKAVETRLRERLAVLKNRMEDIDDDLGELGDDDFAEMATEAEDDEVLENVGLLAQKESKQILLALGHIKQGSYGKCQKCGVDIMPARLEAVPHAVHCIKCAS